MYPGRVKYIEDAFTDATSVPYDNMLIDLKQGTPEHTRQQMNIFPDDDVQYSYLPRT